MKRPVSLQEIQEIQQTNLLFKSNLFKLQIQELVKARLKLPRLQQVLVDIKAQIMDITPFNDSKIHSDDNNDKLMHSDIGAINLPFLKPKANLKFSFEKPEKIDLCGSLPLDTIIKQKTATNVDLCVTMPNSIFQEKDYLDNRYFYKRACYLATIAAHLEKLNLYKLEYSFLLNDYLRPVLVLESTDACAYDFTKKNIIIRIIPCINENAFDLKKLAPLNANLRNVSADFYRLSTLKNDDVKLNALYNASILQESCFIPHMNLINSHLQESDGLRDAIVMAKVWCQQRGLNNAYGKGMSGFIISMIMCWLFRVKNVKTGARRISKNFSAYQIFKITLELLASHDFTSSPLFLTDDGNQVDDLNGAQDFGTEAFLQAYNVAIIDPTGKFNLVAHMSKSSMQEAQFEAKITCDLLKDSSNDTFAPIFLKNVDRPVLKYDNIFRIPRFKLPGPKVGLRDRDLVVQNVHTVLTSALGNRVKLCSVWIPSLDSISIDSNIEITEIEDVTIGLILNESNSLVQVEKGPAEDQEKIDFFRSLWGSKAELRRFQDGSICESVVFDTNGSLEQKSLITARMTAFLLDKHFNVGPEDGVLYWAGLGNKYLRPCSVLGPEHSRDVSFQPLMDAYQDLIRQLKSLELPLDIHKTHAKSPELSLSSCFYPQKPTGLVCRAFLPEFLIEFETSGKWPDDMNAIEQMKRAFAIKIINLLKESDNGTTADIYIDQNNVSFIEFAHSSGYLFKSQIYVPRMDHLIEQSLRSIDKGLGQLRHDILKHQKSYLRANVYKPKHTMAIHNLCLRFPFLSLTIRLTKRWLYAHMGISDCEAGLAQELVETICTRVYTVTDHYNRPNSGWQGFLRVLDLLSTHDFQNNNLHCPFQEENFLTPNDKSIKDGKILITTDLDWDGVWWNSSHVNPLVVSRIKLLARSALAHVENLVVNSTDNDISKLFKTPLDGYDAIIYLDTTKYTQYFNSLKVDLSRCVQSTTLYKNIVSKQDQQIIHQSRLDFLKMYRNVLVERYGSLAMFVADEFGGDKICIVWKQKFAPIDFKVNTDYNFKIEDEKICANYHAMYAGMQELGGGLVSHIKINKE